MFLKSPLIFAALISSAIADQPIMNMMPRWDGGYGIQVRSTFTHRSDLLQGDKIVGKGFSEDIHQIHLEGVYTWDRAIRLTMKVPYVVDARREQLVAGTKRVQRDSGLGDITLALPIKKYFNIDGRSGSWTLAPQLRIPTASRKSTGYDVYDRSWGTGLTLGYETETSDLLIATGITGWVFEKQDTNEFTAHLDLGWNFRDNASLLWETDFKWQDDNSQTLSAGPALYWRFTDTVHVRLEWKHDFISKVEQTSPDHGNGDTISVGIGFVW